MQPLWVDNAAKTPNESCCLLLNLLVHPEVSHEVDVANPGRTSQSETGFYLVHYNLFTIYQIYISVSPLLWFELTCFHL